MAWAAVRAVARAERRTGVAGLVLMGVLFGIVTGVVLGTVALAGRTASAYDRLVDAVGLDDARVQVATDRSGLLFRTNDSVQVATDQPQLVAAVPRLPGVREAWVSYSWVAQVEGPSLRFVTIGAGVEQPPDMIHPVVVAGRAPEKVDELLIGEPLAEQGGVHVGSVVTLKMLTLRQVSMFDVGFGEPDGPTVRMTVVGVGRMPAWGGALAGALATPAFAQRYSGYAAARPAFVRLTADPGAAQAFTRGFAAAAAAADQLAPSAAAPHLPHTVALPRTDVDPAVAAAEQALVVGLAVFAAVLGAGGLLVVGQGIARHHGARRAPQLVEAVLGMGRADRVAARVLAAAPAAAVAAVLAGAITVAAGLLEPLGSQARFEPEPGFRPDWGVAVVGTLATAAVYLAVVAAAASVAGARDRRPAPARRPSTAPWGARRPAVLLGLGLAVRGRGLAGVVAPVAAVVAVAGIVAALAFGASVQRLVADPVRYGAGADLRLEDARTPDVQRLVADPRVTGLAVLYSATSRTADGSDLAVLAVVPRKGAVPVDVTAGRAPVREGEIALNPRVADRLGVGIGDVLRVQTSSRRDVPVTVVGTAVVVGDNGSLGGTGLLAPSQIGQLAQSAPLVRAVIVAAPGQADALRTELGARLEITERSMPPEVRNLADLLRLPEILAGVLAVVAGAAVAHTLLAASRRHLRDVTVLAVLGATPGQVRATLAVTAAATVLPVLLLGIPLGLGTARVLWDRVAISIGVGGDLAVPVGLLVLAVPAVVGVALLLAVLPAVRSARRPAAELLRA